MKYPIASALPKFRESFLDRIEIFFFGKNKGIVRIQRDGYIFMPVKDGGDLLRGNHKEQHKGEP